MYRALITDLDGSAIPIASDGSEVSMSLRRLIREAQQAGLHIACVTGRDWDLAKPVVQSLGLTAHCIVSGGSAIINPLTEEIIWEQALAPHTIPPILAAFKNIASRGDVYFSEPPFETPLTSVHTLPDQLRYLYLIGVLPGEAEHIRRMITTDGIATAHLTPSWEGGGLMDVHVTHRNASKEHALKEWHKLEGVQKQETIGFGDSDNDLPLFQAAGLKVAAGNATNTLKAAADYTAPSVEDGALEHIITKFLLPKNRS